MSTGRLSPSLAIGVAFGLLVAGDAAVATGQPPPPSSLFGEEIDVRVVNVEVVVTDAQGVRTAGLTPADFALTVDGKPVAVEYFSEIRDGRAQPAAAPDGGSGAPAPIPPLADATAGTHYLVFIDDYFAVAPQRDQALAALQRSLGELRPEDRMGIVAFDGGRLVQLSGWSGSRSELAGALDQAVARTAHGFDRATELRSFAGEQEVRSQFTADGVPIDLMARGSELREAHRVYGGTLIRQIQASAGAAVSAMRAFAQPRGRKVLLLLAGGWPYSVRSLVAGGESLPRHELPEGDEVLAPLVDTANLLGYTIYPVDVPGPRPAGAGAEAGNPALLPGQALELDPRAATFAIPGPPLIVEEEIEASLRFLARETGGRPILDGDRAEALATASADTRSFYWLGFTPSWRGDDRTHRLAVEVRRPGMQVRSRSGFLDLSRQAEVTMRLESALLLGSFPGALQMPMKVGIAKRTRRGGLEVPVTLGLPVDLMTVVPVDRHYAVKLELRFAASDEKGAASEIPVIPITLSSATPPTPGKFVRHEINVTLQRPADHLVVAVYDPLSDRVATAATDLTRP